MREGTPLVSLVHLLLRDLLAQARQDAPQLVAREPACFHVEDDREGINELLLLVVLRRLRSAMTTTNVKAIRLRPFAIEIAQAINERYYVSMERLQ